MATLRKGQDSADAHRVAPKDWSVLGARIRRMAMAAAAFHLAERAETPDEKPRPRANETKD